MIKPAPVLALALGLSLALTEAASAQGDKGKNELLLQGSVTLNFDSDSDDTGSAAISWGRFFTNNQQAGLVALTFFDSDGDLAGSGGPFWRYNFGDSETVPFLGVAATTAFSDSDISGDFLITFEGGVRWFLERNMAFSLSGQTSYDTDASEFNDRLQVLFGFSYFWER